MGSPSSPITILFLVVVVMFFTNHLLGVGASSSDHDDDNGDFDECLRIQLQSSNNSTTDGIYAPDSASYASLMQTNNLRPASTSPEKPLIIFTPFYDHEIRAAIYCSKKLGMQIRVRSGGHDYEGLSYTSPSNDPFVIVDMRNLNRTTSIEESTAWVEAGATLGQLYYALARKSRTLAFTAGSCPTVGVGGHLSGGGYSMMSRKHGIAADNIVDARVMDSDGRIYDRQSMGEDLFWAIRGGGGTSFGIVLAFKVKLVTVPETVTVFNVTRTSEQNATELVHRWQYVADKVDDNLLMRLFLASVRSPPPNTAGNRTVVASFEALYLGGVDDLVPLMKEQFPELGLVEEDCTEMSWIESVLFFAHQSEQPLEMLVDRTPPFTYYSKGKSDYVREPISIDGLRGIWSFLHEEDEDMAELQFSPYGGVMNSFSESETPFPHRSGNIFMIEYVVLWDSPGNEEAERHMNWMRRLYDYMAIYVSKSPRAAYFNYRDLDLGINNHSGITSYDQASVWGIKYFKNNFERLVRVKTEVDPSNFFRNEQSIPPALHDLYSSS